MIVLGLAAIAALAASAPARTWYGAAQGGACVWAERGVDHASVQVNGAREHFCIAAGPIESIGPGRFRFAPGGEMAAAGCRLELARDRAALRLSDPGNSCACPAGALFDGRVLKRSAKPTMKMCED